MMIIESLSHASAFHMLVWSVSEQCINFQTGTICLYILWLKNVFTCVFILKKKIPPPQKKREKIRPTDPWKIVHVSGNKTFFFMA